MRFVRRGIRYGITAALGFMMAVGTFGCVSDVMAPADRFDAGVDEGAPDATPSGGPGELVCTRVDGQLVCRIVAEGPT